MSASEIIKTSNQLIALGKTGEAIKQLLHFAEKGNLDKEVTEKLLLLSSRYNSLRQDNIIGVISNSDFHIASNQISQALLNVISDISNVLLIDSHSSGENEDTRNQSTNQIIVNGNVSESTIIIGNENKIQTSQKSNKNLTST